MKQKRQRMAAAFIVDWRQKITEVSDPWSCPQHTLLLSLHSSLHILTRREEKRKREEEKQVKTIEHTRRQSPGMVCVTYTYLVFSLLSATKESLTCQRLYLKSVHAYLISHLLSSQHREQSVVTYTAVDRQADWQMDWRRDRRTDRRTDRGTEKRCSLHAGVWVTVFVSVCRLLWVSVRCWQELCECVVCVPVSDWCQPVLRACTSRCA